MDKQSDILKLQQSQLKILKDLKVVCDANNIKFYLAFGTALGCIRHKGFIPWDDDIDIYMRQEDLNALLKLQPSLPSNLFVQTRDTDPEFGLLIARVRDSNTTLIEADHVDRDINHGVYIDIYPLFYCPENGFKMRITAIASYICRLYAYNAPPMNKGGLSTKVASFMLKFTPDRIRKRIVDFLYKRITGKTKSKYVSNFPDVSLGKRFLDKWFIEPYYATFEGEEMPLPTNPFEYLTFEFGDYMQLPPVEKRVFHHQYVMADFNNSYIKYKGVSYCNNKNKK